MDHSQFARLPRELRLIIYEYVLTTDFSLALRTRISQARDRGHPAVRLFAGRKYHRNEDLDESSDAISEFEEDSDVSSTSNEDSHVNVEGDSDSDSDTDFICGNAFYARSFSAESSDSDSDSEICEANPLALAFTCRQLRREALPVFYALNEILLENNQDVHTTFPMLQMMLLTDWLRHIPGAQISPFRHVTISVLDQLRFSDKTAPIHTLAQAIYERYVEFASCFDTSRTRLILDLGDCIEFDPVSARSLFSVRLVRTTFVMTPWTGLWQQVEAHIVESEGRFQNAKEKVMRWHRLEKSVERVQRALQGSEDDTRYIHGVLRQLAELVEEFEGHGRRKLRKRDERCCE